MLDFFLMKRRPPISTRTDTLVPYTTLFRSQEGAFGLGHAEQTRHRHRPRDPARRTPLRFAPILRHETAIDEQGEAGRFERRDHPIARAALGHRLNQRLPIVPETTGSASCRERVCQYV